jgi:drug/metabolite transporter (DMT)-like permease
MVAWYYLALISSALIGFATILEKKTLKKEYASAYSASLSLIVALASLVFLPFLKLDISLESWILIYIVSLLSAASYLLAARTFRHGAISTASPLNAILPTLFIVIFALIFLHEVLTPLQYVGIGITILASYIILFDKKNKKDFQSNKYRQLILINAVITGISGVIFKYVLFTTTPITYLVISQLFMAFNMLVYMNFKYGGLKETLSNAKVYKKELGLIVLLTIGYRITYYMAVAQAPISLVTPLRNTLLVIMTVFSGSLMFEEKNVPNKIILTVLILVGAYLMIL